MNCGHENPYNDSHCPECGVPVENWEPDDAQIFSHYGQTKEIQKAA